MLHCHCYLFSAPVIAIVGWIVLRNLLLYVFWWIWVRMTQFLIQILGYK